MFNFICKGTNYTVAPSNDGLDDFAFAMGWTIKEQLPAADASLLICNAPLYDMDYIPYETWKESMRNLRYIDAHESESWRS